jgi:hypothetical protein
MHKNGRLAELKIQMSMYQNCALTWRRYLALAFEAGSPPRPSPESRSCPNQERGHNMPKQRSVFGNPLPSLRAQKRIWRIYLEATFEKIQC